jgi:hypothetical protein
MNESTQGKTARRFARWCAVTGKQPTPERFLRWLENPSLGGFVITQAGEAKPEGQPNATGNPE